MTCQCFGNLEEALLEALSRFVTHVFHGSPQLVRAWNINRMLKKKTHVFRPLPWMHVPGTDLWLVVSHPRKIALL